MKAPGKEFWEKVGRALKPLLALDYDGTLAPFRAERMEAFPLPGAIEAIEAIQGRAGTEVAIISGRPIAELDQLAGPLARSLTVIGAHGYERRDPGGEIVASAPPPELGGLLRSAHERAMELAGRYSEQGGVDLTGRVEQKAASVAAHVRGLDPALADGWLGELRRAWTEDGRPSGGPGLELLEFDGGIELRAPGRDKGDAIRSLVVGLPGLDLAVYLGDDRTDEDAFRVLAAGEKGMPMGFGVKAGKALADSLACYNVVDIAGVLEFLRLWLRYRTGERKT